MESIKKYSYNKLSTMLSGKYVRFTSDCEFFPKFDVTGKVMNTSIKGVELIFKVKTSNNKIISIGSNMKNLKFSII